MDRALHDTHEITNVCLLAGKIMLQCGAETYRVEDTMARIASAYGIPDSHSFSTPTAILFSPEGGGTTTSTRLLRISQRSTDLQKVTLVNDISRKISAGELSPSEALAKLKALDSSNLAYPLWLQILAAALTSACFLIMFRGTWPDFVPALFAGGAGYASMAMLQRFIHIKFFAEFLGALIIGLLTVLFVANGFGRDADKIIIGSVMPLVPGVLITNAVRDLMAGHLVSGVTKGADAFLTAFAIGSGIAVVLSVY